MEDFDGALVSIQVIIDDIRCKSELKRQKEIDAEKLKKDIEQLKGRVLNLIQDNLELKTINSERGNTES